MRQTAFPTIAAGLLCVAALQSTPAQAQTRVFVAAQGSDANPCTFALPCRTFQHAHDTVLSGGEIDVLDPAGYGALLVTKPLSIQGHGFSGISVTSGNSGIVINAAPSAAISLNGLLIDGGGVGFAGIQFNTGASLVVENCVIRNMSSGAIGFSSFDTTPRAMSVSNSFFDAHGNTAVFVGTHNSGAVTASFDQVGFFANSGPVLLVDGGSGTGLINVTVTDSMAGNNNGAAFSVTSSAGHSVANLVLTRVTSIGNGVGIQAAGANATLLVGHSTVTGNFTGYDASGGGVILSYGDNNIGANTGNTGSLTSASKQ
jgi:hypothetical protein